MRISDWSSDVCSSDLVERGGIAGQVELLRLASVFKPPERHAQTPRAARLFEREPGFRRIAVISVAGAVLPIGLREALERSEEHTSELQSLMRISYAVFCLKKTTRTKTKPHKYQQLIL